MSSLQEARNLAPRVLSLICSYAQGKLLVQCSSFVQTTVVVAVADSSAFTSLPQQGYKTSLTLLELIITEPKKKKSIMKAAITLQIKFDMKF